MAVSEPGRKTTEKASHRIPFGDHPIKLERYSED